MSDVADSALQGSADNAESGASGSKANQTGSGSQATYVTADEFQKLQSQIEAMRRSLQSEKDKGVKRVEERVSAIEGDLKSVLQNAAKQGRSITDVLEEIDATEERETRQAMLEMARAFREGRFPQAEPVGNGQGSGVDVDAVLKELELDDGDVRVKEFRSRPFSSEAEAYREAAKLAKKILTTQPSEADKPSPEGKRQATPTGQQALMEEYNRRKATLYGRQLMNLKREMRERGLEIS